MKKYQSHGSGDFEQGAFRSIGQNVIFEPGVLVFHPENISIGNNVYVGHNAILKGYYRNRMEIADDVWIGQNCFLHSAGGIVIDRTVGIGPGVKILTSSHDIDGSENNVMDNQLEFNSVHIGRGADIGVGTILLPGVKIGDFAVVGAGSVVIKSVPAFWIAAGVPSRLIRERRSNEQR